MNERIKELVRQAWKEAYNVDPADPRIARAHKAMEEGMEKFAELIVKECAEIADNADATREKWQSIGKFVREHFGVEE
jgi:hypothetical protein